MKEQFVTYEIALKLKELGFDEECLGWFWGKNPKLALGHVKITELIGTAILAPIWQQAFDWFREKHDIHITIDFAVRLNESTLKITEIVGWNSKIEYCRVGFDLEYTLLCTNGNVSYYEAREQAILKAIELCQKEK
jgi:hypothetical protein